jgi:hypothetical protein
VTGSPGNSFNALQEEPTFHCLRRMQNTPLNQMGPEKVFFGHAESILFAFISIPNFTASQLVSNRFTHRTDRPEV